MLTKGPIALPNHESLFKCRYTMPWLVRQLAGDARFTNNNG